MKVWLLSLLVVSCASALYAQPVDLLQQLYGQKTLTPSAVPNDSDIAKPAVTEVLTLTLCDRFEANRERIFLSDVAKCMGGNRSCDDIFGIDIGPSPKPLRYDRIARAQVAQLIGRDFPSQIVRWEGPEYCQISAASMPIDERAVMKALADEFEDSPAGLRVVIQNIRVPSLAMLRHNNYHYKIQDLGDQIGRVFQNPRTRLAQIKMVAVDNDPASQSSIEFLVQVSLRIEIEALVLRASRERGERLSSEDVEMQWINFQDNVLTDAKQIQGKLLKARVQAHNPVRAWDLTREPEVLRGDKVEAVISGNGLKMNSTAQALEQGFVGQKIRIRMEATKKVMTGVVVARAQVEVPSL
jgi:flagella basal body P-ring formation protein FlgA